MGEFLLITIQVDMHDRLAMQLQDDLTERIVQHAPVMMAYIDQHLIYRWNNPLHSQVFGVLQDRLIGRHVTEVLPEAALARTMAFYRHVLETRQPARLENVPFAEREGRQTYWDANYVPVIEDDEVIPSRVYCSRPMYLRRYVSATLGLGRKSEND